MTTSAVIPVNGNIERGCGYRQQGAVYITCGLAPEGYGGPLEDFLLDPPVLVPEHLQVPDRGVTVLERDGVFHVVDRVGSAHYPNVADFIEETRRFGLSRRLPINFEFEKLTSESRIILCHERAYVGTWSEYRAEDPKGPWHCPKSVVGPGRPGHPEATDGPCLGIVWEDITEGEVVSVELDGPLAGREIVKRTMPSFEYRGHARPSDSEPEYALAFFMSMPITAIEVVRDRVSNQHESAWQKASAADGIQVEIVDE